VGSIRSTPGLSLPCTAGCSSKHHSDMQEGAGPCMLELLPEQIALSIWASRQDSSQEGKQPKQAPGTNQLHLACARPANRPTHLSLCIYDEEQQVAVSCRGPGRLDPPLVLGVLVVPAGQDGAAAGDDWPAWPRLPWLYWPGCHCRCSCQADADAGQNEPEAAHCGQRTHFESTTPGVSYNTTCVLPSVNAPSLLYAVVLVLGDTADTCAQP
jgi:hypothetical protein